MLAAFTLSVVLLASNSPCMPPQLDERDKYEIGCDSKTELFVSPKTDVHTADQDGVDPATQATSESAWVELPATLPRQIVRIWSAGQPVDSTSHYYVITHGMGGTVAGDRFHKLAAVIQRKFPHDRVLRIDWSVWAMAKIGGIPNPWQVAQKIDDVGDQVALALKQASIDPKRTTFIGESFGNWVNARSALRLGGVQGILAMNPASEGAGYVPPDLRKYAKRSSSFHTRSIFDTRLEITDRNFWLETPVRASHWEQHVFGIQWLYSRLEADDQSWLDMDQPLPQPRAKRFRASALLHGKLSPDQPMRNPPVPVQDKTASHPGESGGEPDVLSRTMGMPAGLPRD